jgi:hypothetical protein
MLLLSGVAYRQLLATFAGIPPGFGVDSSWVILVTVILITALAGN